MIIRRNVERCGSTNTVNSRPCRNEARSCHIAAHKQPPPVLTRPESERPGSIANS